MMARCTEKKQYGSRIAAECALAIARRDWRRDPDRADGPPIRIYYCPHCGGWHLTHAPLRGDVV